MADDFKSGKEVEDSIRESRNFARNLKEEFLALDGISNSTKKKMSSIAESLKTQNNISGQLNTLVQERDEFIEKEVKAGRSISKKALEILDTEIELLKKKKKQVDLQEELADIGKDFTKDLAGALGISEELLTAFKKLSIAAIALVILKEVASAILSSVNRVKEFKTELGLSVKNSIKLQSNIQLARLSMTGLLEDGEKFNQAAAEIVKQTGSINISPETIENVTRLTSLLDDASAATSLTRTLSNAGVDAGKLTDEIEDLANSMGMDAGPAMEFLADNQLELGGMTREQIKLRAEEALIMKKMGADMKQLNQLAGEALNIEESLRNEMKLRMITGKEISFNELRAAQVSGDALAVAKAQQNLVASLGDDLHGNLQLQRMISEATGMTKEQMLNINNATQENTKIQEELVTLKDKYGLADIEQAKQLQANLAMDEARVQNMKLLAIEGGVVLGVIGIIAVAMKKFGVLGGGKTNPISNFIKSMGSKQVLMGAAAMLVISASLMVTAKALNEFNTVDLATLGKAGLALIGVTAAVAALGAIMSSGIGAVAILAGATALVAIGGALVLLGGGISLISNNIAGLENLVPLLTSLVLLSPGLLALSGSLTLLSGSLLALSVGLAAVSLFLPVLGAVSSIVGGAGNEGGNNGGSDNSGVIDELRGLRKDIQTQPIMINVDGRVVSEISRVQRQQNSVRTTGYGR